MTTIEAGENTLIILQMRDPALVAIPTATISRLSVIVSVNGKTIQSWLYVYGNALPVAMAILGAGKFVVELNGTAGVAGIAEIFIAPTFVDAEFIATGGQTDVMVVRDQLTIIAP